MVQDSKIPRDNIYHTVSERGVTSKFEEMRKHAKATIEEVVEELMVNNSVTNGEASLRH